MPLHPQNNIENAIRSGNYDEVWSLVKNNNYSVPLATQQDTAIEDGIKLCLQLQSSNQKNASLYQAMLQNIFLPLLDRYLIGNNKANRDDWMQLNNDGSFTLLQKSATDDKDDLSCRQIGRVDFHLSDDFQKTYIDNQHTKHAQEEKMNLSVASNRR